MRRPDRLPEGFAFDPYLGEGLGALRMGSSGMKIADEVDEGMAHALAWSIVEPEIERRDRERSSDV